MQLKRVVVTGIGALTPIGNTAKEYWDALANGVSGAAPITHFNAEKFKTRFACEVKNFNVNDHLDRKEARKMDPFTQYAMVAADEAVKDSGILDTDFIPEDVGVIWASGIGGLHSLEKEIRDYYRPAVIVRKRSIRILPIQCEKPKPEFVLTVT